MNLLPRLRLPFGLRCNTSGVAKIADDLQPWANCGSGMAFNSLPELLSSERGNYDCPGVNVTNGTPTTYGSMAAPSTVPIAAHKK
jgi:hypothetical protein